MHVFFSNLFYLLLSFCFMIENERGNIGSL